MSARTGLRDETRLGGLLLLLALGVYANSLANGFLWDDYGQILQNPFVHNFGHLREVLTRPVWFFQGAEGSALSYYRPVMTVVNLLGWHFFGNIPFGYHLVNVALNAMVVCLVFILGQRLFRDRMTAVVAAALFAIHPVHTESVAWIAGATDLELTFFYLLTFWCFLTLPDPGRPGPWARRLLLGASFALALLSKEQAVTLPVLATMYEHFYRGDRGQTTLKEKASRYGLPWGLTGMYLLLRLEVTGGLALARREGITPYQAVLTGLSLLGRYAGKLVWPVHLALFYAFHKSVSLLDPGVLLGLASLGICAGVWLAVGVRRPAGFAVVWLAVTLAPVLDVRWLVANAFAERYLYLPSVGFCWLAAYGARRVWLYLRHRPAAWRRIAAGAAAGIAVLCAIRVVSRNAVWRSPETFVVDAAGGSSDGDFSHVYLGSVYRTSGQLDAADRELMEAFKSHPDDATLLEDIALLRADQKRYPEAIDFFERAIQRQPNNTYVRLAFGNFCEQIWRTAEAEEQFRAAVGISPFSTDARNDLGLLLLRQGRFADAEGQFLESVKIDPTPAAYHALGDIYLQQGNDGRAEWAFSRAAAADPFDGHAHFSLGRLYEARGSSSDAVREYRAGLETDPNNAEALAALARLKR